MPINKAHYPPNWTELSTQVKTDAGWKCEWCSAPHLDIIRRINTGTAADWEKVSFVPHPTVGEELTSMMNAARLRYYKLTKVVITTAHLNRDSTDNRRENLAALCQRCHLSHDILQHVENRRYGRDHKREHQLKIF